MNGSEYIRAQFSQHQVDPYLDVSVGDIFKIIGKEENGIIAEEVKSGRKGLIPRRSKAFYVDVKRESIGYIQPVILMGSLATVMNDLLVQRAPDVFNTPVPHTTRIQRSHEKHGIHYFFVKHTTMEQMLDSGIFIDCYEVNGILYGVSEASIRKIAQKERKHCLLEENTAVPRLLHRKIHPLVIYVTAKSWEQLCLAGYTEIEARERIQESQHIYDKNLPYFHAVVRESSTEETYHRLLEVIRRLRNDCWLPRVVERTRLI